MDPMQADALRRAREMHQNPKRADNGVPTATQTTDRQSPHKEEPMPKVQNLQIAQTDNLPCAESRESSLFADKEKLLILALLLILSTEESQQDPALTLALLYLII